MKVTIVHDRLGNKGGGERVALEIAKALGIKSFFTAYYKPERTFKDFRNFYIVEVNRIPDLRFERTYGLIRMLDAVRFSHLEELEDFDLVWTSGMWAVFAAKNNPNNVWYCHSPNRALYDLYDRFLHRYTKFSQLTFKMWADFWRKRDQEAVSHVKEIVVNSRNVQNRVRQAYGREAEVIYPPVDTKKFYWKPSEGYWLSVQRIMPEKRVDLQIKIFHQLPEERLIIVGKAEYGTGYQKKIAKMVEKAPNVEWVGRVDEKTLIDLYARAKGVIQTAIDEDFGLVPIEAFAAGKPVLAVNEGGFKETVKPFAGRLIEPPYLENFVKTITGFDESRYDPTQIRAWAERFSVERFREKIKRKTKEVLEG